MSLSVVTAIITGGPDLGSICGTATPIQGASTGHEQDTRDTRKTQKRGHQGLPGVTSGHCVCPAQRAFLPVELRRRRSRSAGSIPATSTDAHVSLAGQRCQPSAPTRIDRIA